MASGAGTIREYEPARLLRRVHHFKKYTTTTVAVRDHGSNTSAIHRKCCNHLHHSIPIRSRSDGPDRSTKAQRRNVVQWNSSLLTKETLFEIDTLQISNEKQDSIACSSVPRADLIRQRANLTSGANLD